MLPFLHLASVVSTVMLYLMQCTGFHLDPEQHFRIQGKNTALWGREGAMVLSELRAHVVNVQWQYWLQCHHDLWLLQQSNGSPSEVVQWSNHRVMEWLRSVDLAEYAPNLRGSGVHGALIVRLPHVCFNTVDVFYYTSTENWQTIT